MDGFASTSRISRPGGPAWTQVDGSERFCKARSSAALCPMTVQATPPGKRALSGDLDRVADSAGKSPVTDGPWQAQRPQHWQGDQHEVEGVRADEVPAFWRHGRAGEVLGGESGTDRGLGDRSRSPRRSAVRCWASSPGAERSPL